MIDPGSWLFFEKPGNAEDVLALLECWETFTPEERIAWRDDLLRELEHCRDEWRKPRTAATDGIAPPVRVTDR